MAAANAGDTYGRAKPGDGDGFFVWSPSQNFSIDAGSLSGGVLLSFSKVSLNILFSVYDSAEKPSVHPSRASGRAEEHLKSLEIFRSC